MDMTQLLRLYPTIEMVAEEFETHEIRHSVLASENRQHYRGIRIYSGQTLLETDLLYILPSERSASFPADTHSYICVDPVHGKANHIYCPQGNIPEILERMMGMFERYREQEKQMDQLVLSNASLDELCNLGRKLLGNAICIHDDWFVVIAMSDDLPDVMPPEHVAASVKGFIPRKYIDSFKYDEDYLHSYSHRDAQLWISAFEPEEGRCMYVNLWEGEKYRGRLLTIEHNQTYRPSHFLITECLAQRAMLLLHRRKNSTQWDYHSMDGIVLSLLQGKPLEPADTNLLLETLQWKKTDQYLCIRLQNQRSDATEVLGNVLHGDLFQLFKSSYVMFIDHQQCVVLNLSKEKRSPSDVRHMFAPICRDYCLYAGISSPVWGIEALKYAFIQTDIALEQAFYLKNERWVIPFSSCALDYILRNIQTQLLPGYLVAPELLQLLEYDRKKGTEYFITLRAYLLNDRDAPKTADVLIIHRTTLVYRLKKIQAITNLNLDDPDERLYLQLSLKLLDQLDGAKKEA